jgi:hypothetical protein
MRQVVIWVVLGWVALSVLTVAGVLAHNIWAVHSGRPLVTDITRELCGQYPILIYLFAFAHGVMVTHLFWHR